jgi:hypothetical protein
MRISDPDVALGIKTGGSAFGSISPSPFGFYPGGYDSTGQFHGDYSYVYVSLLDYELTRSGYPNALFQFRPGNPAAVSPGAPLGNVFGRVGPPPPDRRLYLQAGLFRAKAQSFLKLKENELVAQNRPTVAGRPGDREVPAEIADFGSGEIPLETVVSYWDKQAQRVQAFLSALGVPYWDGQAQMWQLSEYLEITAQRDKSHDDANSRLSVQVSLAVTTADQTAAHIFAPRDAFGNELPNPLNLYTNDPALGTGVVRGWARAAPGHLISDTKYYGPANVAESAELASRSLPSGATLPIPIYKKIWGTDASAPAVRDAALSGSVATHSDLKRLRSDSIQNEYELPALRRYGGGAGAVGILGGAALLYGGIQQDDPILAAFGIAGGAVEVAGGAARVVGSFKVNAPLQQSGRTLGTAGAILTAPITAHSFYDNLSKGNWFEAATDASSFASAGLTVGGAAAGSALLTEGGLVLGSFGAGVLVGTVIDKSLERATKSALGVDFSPSALIAGQLTTLDQELTTLWSDPRQPAYTQSIAWKILQFTE